MKSRALSAVAGVFVLILSAAWPEVFQPSESSMLSTLGAYLSFVGIMLGVYLLFYSMTGDWLPRLAKRHRRH